MLLMPSRTWCIVTIAAIIAVALPGCETGKRDKSKRDKSHSERSAGKSERSAGKSERSAGKKDSWVPLDVELPPMVFGPWHLPSNEPNVEKPRRGCRPPFLVPPGTVNLAAYRPVTSSDEEPIIGSLGQVTDKDKGRDEDCWVELGPDRQWVQIDLEQRAPIHAIAIWHDRKSEYNYIVYRDVIVQVSDDSAFRCRVQTLFNSDHDNSSGLGRGRDKRYVELPQGKLIAAGGVRARYVRLYSNGNSSNDLNRYTEVAVYGPGLTRLPPPRAQPSWRTILEAIDGDEAAAVVKFLADGVRSDARDGREQTLLHWAADREEGNVARILLTKGADPNLRGFLGQTPLHIAANRGSAPLVKMLLAHGADSNIVDNSGYAPLHQAADHPAVVRLLLAHGAKPNTRDKYGRTPLHQATDHPAVVRLLLAHGAKPNTRDKHDRTPLFMATLWRGKKASVDILLANGADPNATNPYGETPLHRAVIHQDGTLAGQLLGAGAHVNAKTDCGLTPTDIAVRRGYQHRAKVLRLAGGKPGDQLPSRTLLEAAWRGDEAGLRRLLAAGHDANTQGGYDQFTPLHWACGMRRPEIVRLLLAAGADPDAKDPSGHTPLHFLVRAAVKDPTTPYSFVQPYGRNAVDKNKMAIRVALAELLLAKGADVDAADKRGRGPLCTAVSTGQVALIRVLLAGGAKVRSEADGWTALHAAARWRDTVAARLLLEARADANATGRFGDTPLHMAAWDGDVEMARLLLAYGANVNSASGYDDGTPLCVAAEAGEKDLSALLIARGAKVNATTNRGDTALHLAAYGGHEAVVRLLLANGAQVNVRDCKHETPLDLAVSAREHAIAKLLRTRGAKTGQVLKAAGRQ